MRIILFQENVKMFKLINTNYFCNKCVTVNAKEKRKNTNLQTIGNINYFQNETIKNKINKLIFINMVWNIYLKMKFVN
jgi:hypothetical protein